jgi:PTH2 family peptidyl-tRNA hydrolase
MAFLFTLIFGTICFIIGLNFKRIVLKFNKYLGKKEKADETIEKTSENNAENTEEDDKQYEFNDLKMVFLVREDLKLGAGKIAAQVAHAAVHLYDEINQAGNAYYQQALDYWNEYGAKKIVLKAKNLDELKMVKKKCKEAKIPSVIISDAGHTQVDPGTKTVLGIGPEESEKLNKITGEFKLMR